MSAQRNILQTILAAKRDEVAAAKQAVPLVELQAQAAAAPPARDFGASLRESGVVRLIAEIKKASPSAGVIRPDFDPVRIAETYVGAGAAALSVLTDERWFQGSPQFLRDVRRAVDVPLLRKDFMVDAYQLWEARAWGADAALLIVGALKPSDLERLAETARAVGLTALVEVHDAAELVAAVDLGPELAPVIGINNRDLKVFRTDLDTTFRLLASIPSAHLVVSESGIRTPADVARLRAHGVQAMLVGEALMREADFGAKTRELVEAGRTGTTDAPSAAAEAAG